MIYSNATIYTCDHPACNEYAIASSLTLGAEHDPPKDWIIIEKNGSKFCAHTIQCARVILNNMGVEAF